jgi:hypothetical protein
MLDKVKSAHPSQKVEVWFQDEARFGQQGTVTRVWAKTDSRPRAVRQTKYEWLYVIGAVCPASGESVGLLSPVINSDIVNLFIRQFAKEVSHAVHILLVWDQAGFHTSKKLNIPENMTILPLPPYKDPNYGIKNRFGTLTCFPDIDPVFEGKIYQSVSQALPRTLQRFVRRFLMAFNLPR